MPKKQKSHDEFFKVSFSEPRIALSYIRKFVDPAITRHLDLLQLKLEKTSYVTNQLQEYFADIVYSCSYKKSLIRISFLFEHKSSPVPFPHLQLLRYMLEIWETQQKKEEKLSMVLPLVFYHGKAKWHYRSLEEYFPQLDEPLLRYLPRFEYHLLDIGNWSDDQILALKETFLVNSLLVFKHIWDEKFIYRHITLFFTGLEDNIQHQLGRNLFQAIFVYLFKESNFDHEKTNHMVDRIKESFGEEVTNTYDRLVNEGLIKGRKEGFELGQKTALSKTIKKLSLKSFSPEQIAEMLDISKKEVISILRDLESK